MNRVPVYLKHRDIVTVIGKQGYGKSTFIKNFLNFYNRKIVFDPMGEYVDELGYKDIESFDSFVEFTQMVYETKLENFNAALTVPVAEMDICLDFFSNNYVFTALVLEEVDLIAQVNSSNQIIDDLVHRGRHAAIDLFFTARRAHTIPRLYTSQSELIVTFNQTEPRDLKYLQDSDFRKEVLDLVRNAPKHRYYAKGSERMISRLNLIKNKK